MITENVCKVSVGASNLSKCSSREKLFSSYKVSHCSHQEVKRNTRRIRYVFTQDGASAYMVNLAQNWGKRHFREFFENPPSGLDINTLDFAIWLKFESGVLRISY